MIIVSLYEGKRGCVSPEGGTLPARTRATPNRSEFMLAERDFQVQVVELARLLGWRIYHSRPAQYRSGRWATPLTGDAGLPDLILCKPPRLIFAELKSERGRVRAEQQAWLDALQACNGVEVYLWRPSDWDAIVEVLR